MAALFVSGCGVEESVSVPAPAPSSGKTPPPGGGAEKTPVKGAVLEEQGFDSDGDGKVDTWRRLDASTGQVVEAKDTDGDGVPDVWGDVETSKEPPPGVIVEEGDGGALQPMDGPPPEPTGEKN